MRYLRYKEPNDPDLFRISKVICDRWVDERWPQRRSKRQGRWQRWRSSQLVRVHILALIKGLGSFNRACKELRHNADFRRFCRVRPNESVPRADSLSRFRSCLGVKGWRCLHKELLRVVANLLSPSAAGLVLLDSTDLPAAVRRTSKKKTVRRCENASPPREPHEARGPAKVGSRTTSLDTRSIRPAD